MASLELHAYALEPPTWLVISGSLVPWDAAANVAELITPVLPALPDSFRRDGERAVHETATVHPSAVISGPVIIGAGAVIGPHVSLRGGVYLGAGCTIGPSSEVKSSWVFEDAALAHLNYVGNSVIGHGTNIEAGAVLANHFNERGDKTISVVVDGVVERIAPRKFGAAVGPGARIGANAVTTPGTILPPGAVVGRLELVDQLGDQ